MTESIPEFYFPRRPDLLAFFQHPSLKPYNSQIQRDPSSRATCVKIPCVPWNQQTYAGMRIGNSSQDSCFTRFLNSSSNLASGSVYVESLNRKMLQMPHWIILKLN